MRVLKSVRLRIVVVIFCACQKIGGQSLKLLGGVKSPDHLFDIEFIDMGPLIAAFALEGRALDCYMAIQGDCL